MRNYVVYPDARLVFLLGTGDEKAFTELYNRYWERLLFIAGLKLKDLSIAEELVQDIFLDLWNRRTSLDIKGEVGAYLAVSMKYKVINAQVKLKRAEEYKLIMARDLSEEDHSTEQFLQFDELRQRLAALVNELPEKCRITYQLSKEHNLSHKEIATRLLVSEKAVEANLARAMKSLRKGFTYLFFVLVLPSPLVRVSHLLDYLHYNK